MWETKAFKTHWDKDQNKYLKLLIRSWGGYKEVHHSDISGCIY